KPVIVTAIECLEHVGSRVGEVEGPRRVQPMGIHRATRAVGERCTFRDAIRAREGSKIIVEGMVLLHDDDDALDRSGTGEKKRPRRVWRGGGPAECIWSGGDRHREDAHGCPNIKPGSSGVSRSAGEMGE